MGSDFGGVKSIAVPGWLRWLVIVIVLATLAGNAWLFWSALRDPNHKDWFPLALQLLGSLLPLVLAALLLAFSTSGPETLRRKTGHLLLELIPSSICYAATSAPPFQSLSGARKAPKFSSETEVTISYHPGDFYCSYRIVFPEVWSAADAGVRRIAYFVMDLKVYGVNMYLCVPGERLDEYCRASGPVTQENRAKAFREVFRHTLAGAEASGCKVNEMLIEADLDGQHLSGLVIVRSLTTDFLNDPAEQLYVAQDLVAMLRSFWREKPEWFPRVTAGKN
jgi:hypothetical protein